MQSICLPAHGHRHIWGRIPMQQSGGGCRTHERTAAEAEGPRGQVQLPTSFARAGNPNRQAATSPTLALAASQCSWFHPEATSKRTLVPATQCYWAPYRVTPNGASHGVVRQARTKPGGCHPPRARVLSPRPLRRTWVTIAQQRGL